MSILIVVGVALITFTSYFIYLFFNHEKAAQKMTSRRLGPASPRSELGEYGKLEAELKDVENEWSGRSIYKGSAKYFGAVSAVLACLVPYLCLRSATFNEMLATGLALFIPLAWVAWRLSRYVDRMVVIRRMQEWRRSHPAVQLNNGE